MITFIIAAGCAAGTSVTGFAACKMLFLVFFFFKFKFKYFSMNLT